MRKAAEGEGLDWNKIQKWLPYAGAAGLGLGAYALMPQDQELWGLGGLAAGGLAGRMFGDYMAQGKYPHQVLGDMGSELGNFGKRIWGGEPPPPSPEKQGSARLGPLLELLLKHADDNSPVFNSAQKVQLPTPGIQAPAKNTTQQMGGSTQVMGSQTSQQGARNQMPQPYGTASTTSQQGGSYRAT